MRFEKKQAKERNGSGHREKLPEKIIFIFGTCFRADKNVAVLNL